MNNFITNLFNLKSTDIESLDILSSNDTSFVIITLKHRPTPCPHCGTPSGQIHDYYKRTINHPILASRNITLSYNKRRYYCKVCRKPFAEPNPFALPGKRISHSTVIRVMELLKNPSITFSTAAYLTGISHTTAIRIFDSHAGVSTQPFPSILCMDEVYTNKFHQKVYSCVLLNFETGAIYDILPDRKKHTLSSYFSRIDVDVRKNVKYICIDMWKPYSDISKLYFPNALICIDSFHVITTINRAFDKVRLRILNKLDNQSEEYRLLKRYTWLLRKNSSNLDSFGFIDLKRYYSFIGSRYITKKALIEKLISIDPELELSYRLKENYLYLNSSATYDTALIMIDSFLKDILLYDIYEFKFVYRTISNWKEEILNSFLFHNGRRISNGPIENLNSRIKLIKRNGNGYGNFDRFRLRCLYSLNPNSSIRI